MFKRIYLPLLLASVLLAGPAWAVDRLVPSQYSTIGAAVNAASSGDTVTVSPGTYPEHVSFNGKSLTIRSTNPANWAIVQSTIIDPADPCSVCYFTTPDPCSVLDGFTLTGGNTYNGGGIYLYNSNATIRRWIITGNSASGKGGGVYKYGGSATFDRCIFSYNYGFDGGGICNESGYLNLYNCVFYRNNAGYNGGGIYNLGTSVTVLNCTFYGNTASSYAGGIYNAYYCSMTVTNSILWANLLNGNPDQISNWGSLSASYCDIQGGWTGTGNINSDPLFVNAAADDYHLLSGSPCIDAGSNTWLTTDIDSITRPFDFPGVNNGPTTYDMGADEKVVKTIHVDDTATGANNGTSWTNAFRYLQDGLAAAGAGDTIRVAQGIYTPDLGTGYTRYNRSAAFQLKNGVAVQGGYAGYGAATPDERNIVDYASVLSGDLYNNDGSGIITDNSYNVVYGSGTDNTAILDGCLISGGNANGYNWNEMNGGGMYTYYGAPTVSACTFTGNSASYGGGAMYNEGSYSYYGHPVIRDCTFVDNWAQNYGAGIFNRNMDATVSGCLFLGNTVTLDGGAFVDYLDSNSTVTDCTFINNTASNYAGAMDFILSGASVVTNCLFTGNTATNYYGGAVEVGQDCSPTFRNCTFWGNHAGQKAGAVFSYFDGSTMANCVSWGNTAGQDHPEIYILNGFGPRISYSDIAGCGGSGAWNTAFGVNDGGNIDADPLFADTAIGIFDLGSTSPCIDAGNNASVPSGVVNDLNGDARFVDDPDIADTGAGTAPIVDMGAFEFDYYIPNGMYDQPWPDEIPISTGLGGPTLEREYKYAFTGIKPRSPNDGSTRAAAERIDDELIVAVAPASLGLWQVDDLLANDPLLDDLWVPVTRGIAYTSPRYEREFNGQVNNPDNPTETVFFDLYFDTWDSLNYLNDASYRIRQRFDNAISWLDYASNWFPAVTTAPTRIEFFSKTDRQSPQPGYSEVIENRTPFPVISIPWEDYTSDRIGELIYWMQIGRYPGDSENRTNPNPALWTPSPAATQVSNPGWAMREFINRVAPDQAPENRALKYGTKLALLSERRRQHLMIPGLRITPVGGTFLENVFIVTIDSGFVYDADTLLAYIANPTGAFPAALGSLFEVEVEYERDSSNNLDAMIEDPANAFRRTNLEALRTAFMNDQQTLIQMVIAKFNNTVSDARVYTTAKGDVEGYSRIVSGTTVQDGDFIGTGVTKAGVVGKIGGGLQMTGAGHVNMATGFTNANVLTVTGTPTFVISEFMSSNRDTIFDEDGGYGDWIEITNTTAAAADIAGWRLRDSNNIFIFPTGQSARTTIPANGQMLVYANNAPTNPEQYFHTGFALGAGGEVITLSDATNTIVCQYNALAQYYDISFGLTGAPATNTEGFFSLTTPGSANDANIYRPRVMQIGNTAFTLSLWIKTTSNNRAILSKADNDGVWEDGEKQLSIDSSNRIKFSTKQGGTEYKILSTTAINVANGSWHNVVIRFQTTPSVLGYVYIDGYDRTDRTNTNYIAIADVGSDFLRLGFDAVGNGAANFNGTMDDAAIWDAALTASQIYSIYSSAAQGKTAAEVTGLSYDLLLHAPMDITLVPKADTKYMQAYKIMNP